MEVKEGLFLYRIYRQRRNLSVIKIKQPAAFITVNLANTRLSVGNVATPLAGITQHMPTGRLTVKFGFYHRRSLL